MAITTTDGLIAAIAGAQDTVISKALVSSVANTWTSIWGAAGLPGAGTLAVGNTTSGVVPTDVTAGAPLINAFTGANLGYLTGFDVNNSIAGTVRCYDRLFAVGAIALNSLATTTLSSQPSFSGRLPSSNTGGLGLELWLEMVVTASATATTVTVSYTNSGGTAGRTATLDSNVSGFASSRMSPFRLQAGDVGVQSIQSITVGGTVATAGTFNVLITRTIAEHNIIAPAISEPRQDPFKTGMPQIYADSCLALMALTATNQTGVIIADIDIANG